jgi:hypothetical protein
MRSYISSSRLLLCLTASYFAHSQTTIPSSFQVQAQAAVSGGKLFSVVNLTATAEWIAGSLRDLAPLNFRLR